MKINFIIVLFLSMSTQLFSQDSLHVIKWPDWKLKIQGTLKNDSIKICTWQTWFVNGSLRDSGKYEDDKREGFHKTWYINGNLSKEGAYKNHKEQGTWKWYYESGAIDMRGDFDNGLLLGTWTYWRSTGQKEYEGPFVNDKRISIGEAKKILEKSDIPLNLKSV